MQMYEKLVDFYFILFYSIQLSLSYCMCFPLTEVDGYFIQEYCKICQHTPFLLIFFFSFSTFEPFFLASDIDIDLSKNKYCIAFHFMFPFQMHSNHSYQRVHSYSTPTVFVFYSL